jgi:hypothetical protein
VTLTWKHLLDLAKRSRGWDEREFRRVLDRNGIKSATATNWKLGRPIPVQHFALLAGLLGVSTDELHGRGPSAVPGVAEDEATELARAILALNDDQRAILTNLVHNLTGPPPARRARR